MESLFENLIDQIEASGFGVCPNFLDTAHLQAIIDSFETRYLNLEFKSAGISKNGEVVKAIRGDEIFWLEKDNATASESTYLEKIESFITYLNRTCYLGLASYEMHYAHYPVGSFYKKHLDKFKANSNRKLSVILYLNPNWEESHGGELMLYLENDTLKINPTGGKLVVFESHKIEHEVLPTLLPRRSITGWLKTT
jgi:SM-20-related protein